MMKLIVVLSFPIRMDIYSTVCIEDQELVDYIINMK